MYIVHSLHYDLISFWIMQSIVFWHLIVFVWFLSTLWCNIIIVLRFFGAPIFCKEFTLWSNTIILYCTESTLYYVLIISLCAESYLYQPTQWIICTSIIYIKLRLYLLSTLWLKTISEYKYHESIWLFSFKLFTAFIVTIHWIAD